MAGTTTKSRRTAQPGSDLNDLLIQYNKLLADVESIRQGMAESVGTATYDPASLADGVGATTTVTCTGAALGDFVQVSFSLDLQGIILTGYVSTADTVAVRFQNESGGVLDLASGTLTVRASTPSIVDTAADVTAALIGDVRGTAITT